MTRLKFVLAGAVLALGAAGGAGAETIRATSGFGPSHVLATDTYPTFFEKLREFTDGRWDGQDTPSGLVAAREMSTALRDGVTELGAVIMPYFAAEFPETMLPAELSVVGSDNRAISAATSEYIVTCAECMAEFRRGGQVFLGADTTAAYNFLSKGEIRTLDDVKGKRIRSGAPLYSAFIEQLGGVPVQMSAGELFEGLSQGLLDATFSSTAELINARLADVVTHVTELNFGVFNAAATLNVSTTLWDRMSAEDRAAVAHASQYAFASGVIGWTENAAAGREAGLENNVQFIDPAPGLRAAADEFQVAHVARAPGILAGRGVTDAEAKVARYVALVEKWEGLVEDVTTEEELAELRWREIFADVDFAQFGL